MQVDLSIHWNSLLVLSYVFCFISFTYFFVLVAVFSNFNTPTLVNGIFVDAVLQHSSFSAVCFSILLLPSPDGMTFNDTDLSVVVVVQINDCITTFNV